MPNLTQNKVTPVIDDSKGSLWQMSIDIIVTLARWRTAGTTYRVQCTYKDCWIRGLLNPRVVELEGCWIRGSLNRRFVESEDCSIQGLFNLRIVKSKGCSIQGLLNPRVVETVLLNSSLCNPWLAAVEVAPHGLLYIKNSGVYFNKLLHTAKL